MNVLPRGRRGFALVASVGVALVGAAAGCSGSKASSAPGDSAECSPFKRYQGHSGTSVSIYSTIRDTEGDLLQQAWSKFSACTGIAINYEGSGEMEAQIQVRVDGGNAPDIAIFPQPGLMARFAKGGKLRPAPAMVKEEAEQGWSKDWLGYGTVSGTFYAAPLSSSVKSFVWYSPKTFKDKGYQIPTTWNQLIKLSDAIAATGIKPWCVGIESGQASGWPATDWIEDIMLRDQGPAVYDEWVNHHIPFNDPKVASAFARAATILKSEKYVNGGHGGVKSIATTSFQEAGLPILQGTCALHRQASFYAAQWPKGTTVAEDGQVYAFYFPPVDPSRGKPVEVAGDLVGAFSNRPQVQAVQAYLASADFANSRAKLGSWVSANKGLDINNVQNPIDKLAVKLLDDPTTVARFDGSDQMPAAVGAGSFWTGMTDWINGAGTQTVLDRIEASWPK